MSATLAKNAAFVAKLQAALTAIGPEQGSYAEFAAAALHRFYG